ncbi:MAG: amidohydrolase family protein [Dehalococcoidia bacterium]
MLITDAQIHVWEVDRPDRPWPVPARNRPQREGGFSAEEALAEMDSAGVDRAVIVPPTWVGENNLTALEAAAAYPDRFAVMGRFDPNAPDAEDRLAHWLDQPGMLGIRVTFLATPRPEQLDDGSLDWFWAACERHRIPLMLWMTGMAPKTAPIAERHPDLTIVLDHMARDLALEPAEVWRDLDDVLALARFPRVSVKVSSVPNFSGEPYPHRDVHPHLRRLFDAFGSDRLHWGTDVTRLRGTYVDCLRLFRDELDFLGAEDRALILGGSLADRLGWPED